jgi:hypothetical protein
VVNILVWTYFQQKNIMTHINPFNLFLTQRRTSYVRNCTFVTNNFLKFCSVLQNYSIVNKERNTFNYLKQCCGSGRFFSGSGSDFSKGLVSDSDPGPYKFSTNFFQQEIFGLKVAFLWNES